MQTEKEKEKEPCIINMQKLSDREEAHNYVPSTKSAFCKDIIRHIAWEGRKL